MNRNALRAAAVLSSVGLLTQTRADVLGSAQNFAVLAGSTVTNTGPTIINGNLGIWTGTALTGFGPGVVNGTLHLGDPVAQQAQGDLATAYNTLAAMPLTQTLTGVDLGGMTLMPGVYFFASSAALTGTLTLNALGDPDARFVFKIASTLTTSTGSAVITINGADGRNVYWQVGSSATLANSTAFQGNIVAQASITLNTGATILNGRALARNGGVTMASNTVTRIAGATCFANCDHSTVAPILNISDLICFLNRYVASDPYANCDRSITIPILDIRDFLCFLDAMAQGCP